MLIPLWAFITLQSIAGLLALLAITLIARAWLRRKDLQTRRCYRCHYDLSATSGLKCPECGREAKSESELFGKGRRWRSTRRGVLTIAAAALVCFAGIFAAWPARMMPNWVFVRCVPTLLTTGNRGVNVVNENFRRDRRYSTDEFRVLVRSLIDGFRSDPPAPYAEHLHYLLWWTRAESTPDGPLTLSERQLADGFIKDEPALGIMLSDTDAINLVEAVRQFDRHTFAAEPAFGTTSWFVLQRGGPTFVDWVIQHYFAPTPEWGMFHEGLLLDPDFSTALLFAAVHRFDHGAPSERLRAAHLIRIILRRYGERIPQQLTTDESIGRRVLELGQNMPRLESLSTQLFTETVAGLCASSINDQIDACRIVYTYAEDVCIIPAIEPIRALAKNAVDPRVRAACTYVLRMVPQ